MWARTTRLATIAFDVLDYDPAEWREVTEDICSALLREDLPGLLGGRWREHEGFFELTGTEDEVARVKDVLDAFAARVVVTPLGGGNDLEVFPKEGIKNGNGGMDDESRRDQEVGRGAGRPAGAR